MAYKEFVLDEGLNVKIYKRRASRSLKLSVTADGTVRVSIPSWAPYRAGLEFARQRQGWIADQRHVPQKLVDGQAIGKAHRLELTASAEASKPSTRVKNNLVSVTYPAKISADDPIVQSAATKAAIRALRSQAEQLLPQRLSALAAKYDFDYGSVSIKQLKGRWGSCDSRKNVVLNLFLMQLPWELIDYVLLHELVHTRVLRHGPDFWAEMAKVSPSAKALRKSIRDRQPVLYS